MCHGRLYFHDCAPYKVFLYLPVELHLTIHPSVHPSVRQPVYVHIYLLTYLLTKSFYLVAMPKWIPIINTREGP